MNTRTQERVERWESRSFSGGYGGLRDLSDSDFSGAVEAAGAWLFMLNGRVVGIHEGSIEDFEDASGTAHVAPDPALPLLFSMWETGGETQGKYYTEDTSISEVDDTLTSGSFTGYLELSENVLSGDYYVVYYGGRSMSAAFVGNKEELLGSDEAFERADDEVGIYEVIDVDVDVIEIPEPDDADATDDSEAADDAAVAGGPAATGDREDVSAAGTDASVPDDASAANDAPAGASTPDDTASSPGETTDRIETAGRESTVGGVEDSSSPASDADARANDPDARSAEERIAGYEDVEFDDDPGVSAEDADDAIPGSDPDGLPDELVDDIEPASSTDPARTPSSEDREPDDDASGDVERRTDERPPVDDRSAARDDPHLDDRGDSSGESDRGAEPRTGSTEADEQTDRVGADDRASRSSQRPDRDAVSDGAVRDRSPASDAGDAAPARDPASSPSVDGPAGRGRSASDRSAGSVSETPDDAGAGSEIDWENVSTIPSLDPDHSSTPEPADAGGTAASASAGGPTSPSAAASGSSTPRSDNRGVRPGQNGGAGGRTNEASRQSSSRQSDRNAARRSRRDADGQSSQPSDRQSTGADRQRAAPARSAEANAGPSQADLEEREERIEKLEAVVERVREERDDLKSDRDRLEGENDSLRDEIAQLEGEIERLESEVDRLESALEDAGVTAHDAATQLHPSEAIAGTNLFVRYRSKGEATLESAHAGDADADAVNGNVRLERHTQFDADDAAVNGQPYGEFLESTLEYQFVRWTVEQLLYEIRDTGHAGGLKDLYDALPDVDRAELGGEVDIVYEEGGEQITEQATFDVVLRDRMGNPLVVADLNDSRDPATESMLVELESAASRIKQANDELAAAFLVTSSFFEPGALEAVAEATSGSLLSRDSRESFVKLSRKQGYHLCLVEARADEFHINVPEL